MKLITMLGKNDYQKAIYEWQGKRYTSKFIQEVLYYLLDKPEVHVLATKKAQDNHKEALSSILPHAKFYTIPEGENEEELWQIFHELDSIIEENDEIVFDITHSLRHLPIIILSAAVYYAKRKNARIKYILYGAYELSKDGVTPVLNLSSFQDIIDLTYAVKQYEETGRAKLLQQFSIELKKHLREEAAAIGKYGSKLQSLSQSITIPNGPKLKQHLEGLQKLGSLLNESNIQSSKGKALLYLFQELHSTFPEHPEDDIDANMFAVEWALEKELYQQALTLARELGVTYYMIYYEGLEEKILDKTEREKVEGKMHCIAKYGKDVPEWLRTWSNEIILHRNALNHAHWDKYKEETSPETIKNAVLSFLKQLKADRDKRRVSS